MRQAPTPAGARAGVFDRLMPFIATAAVFVALLWPFLSYVPIWDGRVYTDCAIRAAEQGLSMESLRCAGHPSQGYGLLLALSQIVAHGDVAAIHTVDVILGLVALGAFRVVLARVFQAPEHARQLDALTLACAVHPVLLSTLLQVNIDFGVYVFFFAALASLMSRRFIVTAIAGVFLCFSKETGALAYWLMLAIYAAFAWGAAEGPAVARVKRLVPLWVTVVPLVLFAAHVVMWNGSHAEPTIWKHGWQKGPLDGFNFFDLSEPVFLSYAAGLFLLGFGWVVSLVLGADLTVAGIRTARRLPNRAVPGADSRALAFVTVLTVVLTYVLTSFRTWSNLRYFALLYPLFMLLAFAALLRLGAGPRMRSGAIAIVTLLFALAAFRSVDPVSRFVYGTFPTGDREMYRMASITGEYHGPGRDQLVYNLEFTGYHAVQNALFRQLRPTNATAVATGREARWNIFSPLDAITLRRTLRPRSVVTPRFWDEESLRVSAEAARPRELWYLEFSYRPDADTSLRSLAGIYRETAVVRTTVRGHTVVAHRLELRAP